MSLSDHVAILTHHALAQPIPNKKLGKPLEFYGLFAFPPEAQIDLAEIAGSVTNGAPLGNFEIGITTNARSKKPIVGIPGDWFVVRAATQYAPYIADAAGNQLEQQNPTHAATIKATFFAGKKVRVMLSAFPWVYDGRHGISFNLSGVMDAGEDSTRLAIGNGQTVLAFQKHANSNAAVSAPPSNPFGTPQINPFSVPVSAPPSNPFAQTGNPFAR